MKRLKWGRLLGRKNQIYTGVDIGTHQIKVVRISRMNNGAPGILSWDSFPTLTGGWQNGLDHPDMVFALGEALQNAGVGEEDGGLITAIGGGRVILRDILMPVIPGREMEAAVKWEAERHIPLPVDELIIRHVHLGEVEVDGVVQRQVLLVAVSRQLAEQCCALFREVGQTLLAIDVPALALWRLFFGLPAAPEYRGAVAVLHIGTTNTELIVSCEGRLRYTRSLPGWDEDNPAVARPKGKMVMPETAVAVDIEPVFSPRSGVFNLLREIRRSLEWYHQREPAHPVGRIIISGRGGHKADLADFLAAQVGLPVDPGRFPVMSVANGLVHLDPAFAVAAGLALREVLG